MARHRFTLVTSGLRYCSEMLSAQDDFAIRALYAAYNHAIHRGDAAAWAGCFTRSGRFSNRQRVVEGEVALREYAADFSKDENARYWVDNLILEATDAGASGTCYLMILHTGAEGGPPSVNLTGIYTDSLVLIEGKWRFSARHIARDM
ncbi:MAG: nuclear transport factor 2 family protein [bacterium]